MTDIQTIIFSKNRACQLDLLLRTLTLKATILYTHDKEFEKGYEILIKKYPEHDWVFETDFKTQTIQILTQHRSNYVMFLVDDDVMLRDWDANTSENFEIFMLNDDILCMSLRMCPEYNNAPAFCDNAWEWQNCKKDWGYPMSVTSTIFRKSDILPQIHKYDFDMPNTLENMLKKHIPDRPLMICEDFPIFINVLANQVQSQYQCTTANISIFELELHFLEGHYLSIDDIKSKSKFATHPFIVTKYEYS